MKKTLTLMVVIATVIFAWGLWTPSNWTLGLIATAFFVLGVVDTLARIWK